MRRRMITAANLGTVPGRFYEESPVNPHPPTAEQLERELEVLRGKIRSLLLAQHRIERAADDLASAIAASRRRTGESWPN